MLSRFIGIPFKVGGEDFEGCDCWGLVKLYFKQILDIDIPDYRVDESLIKEEISVVIKMARKGYHYCKQDL